MRGERSRGCAPRSTRSIAARPVSAPLGVGHHGQEGIFRVDFHFCREIPKGRNNRAEGPSWALEEEEEEDCAVQGLRQWQSSGPPALGFEGDSGVSHLLMANPGGFLPTEKRENLIISPGCPCSDGRGCPWAHRAGLPTSIKGCWWQCQWFSWDHFAGNILQRKLFFLSYGNTQAHLDKASGNEAGMKQNIPQCSE